MENPRVRWVDQENQGIGGASNTAVQLCRGVFIGQLDSDDLLLPEAVEIMLEEIQRDTRIGLYTDPSKRRLRMENFWRMAMTGPNTPRKTDAWMHSSPFQDVQSERLVEDHGFATDIKNAVDFDMFLKMSEVTEMRHVREWSYVYRIHDKKHFGQ